MATSQFCSVCLAHDSIRACRAFWLASPCPFPRSFLHATAMPFASVSLRECSGYCPKWRAGPSLFASRALSSISSSPRNRKPPPTSQNPRDEIRRLDDEIRRLENERRSVGKPKRSVSDYGEKSPYNGKKGNATYSSGVSSRGKNLKPSPVRQSAKFASTSSSRPGTSARALARYEQEDTEDEEEEEEEEEDELVEGDDENEDDFTGDNDEELGENFSSDGEMYMESSDAEQIQTEVTSKLATVVSQKPSTDSPDLIESSLTESSEVGTKGLAGEAQSLNTVEEVSQVDGEDSQSGHGVKHPWKEWNEFFQVLVQKNYFKDEPPDKSIMEGEGYLKFQSTSQMKRAILEFSRERDDIIRFLTKKHIKVVVGVGCPSTDRKVVNASKRLRVLCEIPEDEVCQQCKLKTFCTRAFAAPSPDLLAETVDVARVLYSFALNASPIAESQVSYPVVVVKSACHLVNEIVQLSAYPKDPGLPALKARLPVKPSIEKRDIDSNHRTGDWTCPECNFQNFAKNRQCRECGTSKESGKPLELGDWECPECMFVNFRRNRECRECSTPRPSEVASGNEPSAPGEWKCPECNFVNFRRNTECRKCSIPRPKGIKLYTDEDLEPGDWLCPECNFKNFKRNKSCKECGTVSPDQGRRDERWGLRKSVSSGGWGSARSIPSVSAERGVSSGRTKHQEWTPDFSRKIGSDTDEDLEEDADLIFGSDGNEDEEDVTKSSHVPENKRRVKVGMFQRKDVDDDLPRDLDLSDLYDLPKTSSKKSGRKGKSTKRLENDEDDDDEDEEDDDNEMEQELVEDESGEPKHRQGILDKLDDDASDDGDFPRSRAAMKSSSSKGRWSSRELDDNYDDHRSVSRASMKSKPAKSKGFSKTWDDSDDDDDDDETPLSRVSKKGLPTKGRGPSRSWEDSDDDEGFSDDDDDPGFGGHRRRGSLTKGRGKFGSNEGQRDGRIGFSRGRGRGESFSRGSSRFSDSDNEGRGKFGSNEGQRDGRIGLSRGRGRGESFARRSSRFSDSDNEGDFRNRGGRSGTRDFAVRGNGGVRGGRGSFQGRGFRGRGRGRGRN